MVPLLHGAIASANAGDPEVAPGMVTLTLSELGQLVSAPTGTSENWKAKCAVDDGAIVTADGPALAGGDRLTDSPFTMVTVSGAPLPENSAIVGYPFAVHAESPVLVTVMMPVMVPAAPSPCPAEAVMWLHAGDAATVVGVVAGVRVVEDLEDVEVVEEVDAELRVVVVECCPLGLSLLHAAKTRPAPARSASARTARVTPRSLPAAPNRGTGGIGRPVRPVCPPPLHRCRGRG